MQPFLPKYSLKHRFLLVLIGLSLVLSVVVITAYHHIRLQRIENELALQLGVAVAHTGPLILQAHEAGETQMLRALMQALFGFPAVDCVFLAQTEGRILASWPPDACSTSQSDLFFPLSHHDVSLHIVTQKAYAYEEVRRSTALFGLSVLVLLVSIAGLVYLLIGRFVMGPLAKLQNAMERSAPDNPVLARELRDDEIGQLARAYNRLAAAARRFFAQLRETEAQVRKSETRFKDMAEISGDWFYEMDAALQFSYISDRFFEITGLENQLVLGKTRQMVADEFGQQPQIFEHLSTLQAREDFRDFEYVIRSGDGKPCYISVSGKPIFDEAGQFLGYRGTGRDVTLLREKEHLLAEANRNFGDSVSYASWFQHRLLKRPETLSPIWGELELIWQPRDMVGGDFLKNISIKETEYLICFDCTGHGVPGAFMVMIVSAVIDRIAYRLDTPPEPALLLTYIHQDVCEASRNGLDCAVLQIDSEGKMLSYAGASMDLFILTDTDKVQRVQASTDKLGYINKPLSEHLTTHQFACDSACFLIMTDGLATQIGRDDVQNQMRMIGMNNIVKILSGEDENNQRKDNSPRAVTRQLMRSLRSWQGQQERRDDVMIIALKPENKQR